MAKVSDVRGKPGDIVLVRGGQPITLWREAHFNSNSPSGTAMPTSMGMIVATAAQSWTYVLWSMPCVLGWVQDGMLRRVT